MKELNPQEFATKIVKDLGMMQPLSAKRKMRYVELECRHCKESFVVTADNAKRRQECACTTCKVWFEDSSMIRVPTKVNDTKTAEFKCECCDNTVTYTKQLSKLVKTVMCKDCVAPLDGVKQSELVYDDVLKCFSIIGQKLVIGNTNKPVNIQPDGRFSFSGSKFMATRIAYMLHYKKDIKDSIVYTIDGNSANLDKSNLTLQYKESHGYFTQLSGATELYTVEKMKETAQLCISRSQFKKEYSSMYAYAVKTKTLKKVIKDLPKQFVDWNDEIAMKVALNYNSREDLKRGNSKAYEYIQKRSANRDKFYEHMEWNSQSDNNVIYIWKVIGLDNVYKIGVTSSRLGSIRIEEVAKGGGLQYTIKIMASVVGKATDIETKLLSMGIKYTFTQSFNGCTEFRTLTDQELYTALEIIKENINETKTHVLS